MSTLAQVRERYKPYAEKELGQKQARLESVSEQRQALAQQLEENEQLITEAESVRHVLELTAGYGHHPRHFASDVASIDNLLRQAEEHKRALQEQFADIDDEEQRLREAVASLERFLGEADE